MKTAQAVLGFAAVVALAALAAGCGGSKASPPPQTTASAWPYRGTALTPSVQQPDFALRDQDGRLVRLSAQRGRVVIVAFLYTHCPDVCPLIASSLNDALRRLGPSRSRVRVLAVSVDPVGDTKASVRRFIRQRGLLPEFRYLTGTRTELASVWRDYHVAVLTDSLDQLGHSSFELMLDPEGRGLLFYDAKVRSADVVHDVRLALHAKA